MKNINFTFLDKPRVNNLNLIEKVLHDVGEEIYKYAKGYFNYVVTTTIVNNEITEGSLYIMVPEISYDYKIMSLEYKDVENVELKFYTLITNQIEPSEINIKESLEKLENRIVQLLETNLVNQTFKYLVDQVELKRENRK
jgi:hypothetical protein